MIVFERSSARVKSAAEETKLTVKRQVIIMVAKSTVYDKMQEISNLHLFVGREGEKDENWICKSEHGAASVGQTA